MGVFEKARELGMEIIDSEPYKKLMDAKAAVEMDEKAMDLMEKHTAAANSLREAMEGKDINLINKLREEYFAIEDAMRDNELIAALNEAQGELGEMTNRINAILRYFMTGEIDDGSDSCSGNCASCKGACAG